jgi:hypothetical protein
MYGTVSRFFVDKEDGFVVAAKGVHPCRYHEVF